MKKYFLVQTYNCDKRRRLIYQVQDIISGENFHLTEKEWLDIQDDEYSEVEAEKYKAELRNRQYIKTLQASKKGK